ncbi:MAG TPA: DUF4922 domain-containing protein [Blastocatellia bacterium]|nr:DUF4922 domain-containing protein [Blastocatellia bacterium]
MNWEERVITPRELAPYLSDRDDGRIIGGVNALIEHQKQTWPMLAEGYAAYDAMETKRINVDGADVIVQHNPKRIRSTAARVDKASVGARACFLCPDSLPVEEKAIPYGDDLMILCNPFPVLDRHLSIVDRRHAPQQIEGNVETLLMLARDLSPDFFVLYNGPRCGASAPDHLHFQACSRAGLPIEALLAEEPTEAAHCDICAASAQEGFELFTLTNGGRTVVVFRGSRPDELAGWVYQTIAELPPDSSGGEPMVNIVCTYDNGQWTLYLFPRALHRPACFFAEGDEQLLVSPGAIDMAGVLVVPERAHFEKLSAERAEAIYAEVSLSEDRVIDAVERVAAVAGEAL